MFTTFDLFGSWGVVTNKPPDHKALRRADTG